MSQQPASAYSCRAPVSLLFGLQGSYRYPQAAACLTSTAMEPGTADACRSKKPCPRLVLMPFLARMSASSLSAGAKMATTLARKTMEYVSR